MIIHILIGVQGLKCILFIYGAAVETILMGILPRLFSWVYDNCSFTMDNSFIYGAAVEIIPMAILEPFQIGRGHNYSFTNHNCQRKTTIRENN